MKVVILAGGFGTRLTEETEIRPKPMVEVGGRPLLWHIMKHYAHFGFKEFYIALGYKGEAIKQYFVEFLSLSGNLTLDCPTGRVIQHERHDEDWVIHLIETGLTANTGGRVLKLRPHLGDEPFMLTYGDGVATVDLRALLDFHNREGCVATVTAVRPPARFGGLLLDGPRAVEFTEKPQIGEGWINGGYMVLEPEIFDRIPGEDSNLERVSLEQLAREGQLSAFRHEGFWQCMDTLRDKRYLESLWAQPRPPWKLWDEEESA
ncbi:MAG: glucose-1-phosphate cytidylyltransferase [Myxococcales bacterium]|nr:MAG: glucose-1-phosphate cytidylyltransferase [Myxococcales bacterium]